MKGNALSNLMLGFCGESELTLISKFKYAALDPDTIILPKMYVILINIGR
jgi:hypothetical protein